MTGAAATTARSCSSPDSPHPHDPYEPPQAHWDRYDGAEIDLPAHGEAALDAHSRRLLAMCELDAAPPDADEIRRARRGYYGGSATSTTRSARLLGTLAELGLADDTVVVFTSDHGDMLGERGLWYKMRCSRGRPASR